MKHAAPNILTLAALMVLSCVSCMKIDRRDFPSDWPPIKTTLEACPDLTGAYANDSPPLAKWFLPKSKELWERVARVNITGPVNGILTVRLIEGSNNRVTVTERKLGTEYRCDRGWLVLTVDAFFVPIPAVSYSEEARFARTTDDRLVVEETKASAGVVLFVPGVINENRWHLYPLAAQ
jgi:hypothetical protein